MAFDAFLKIQSINGESIQKGFEKWIEIESFSWGEERPSGGGGAVPLEVQLVAVTQSASPSIFKACADGADLGTLQLHLTTTSSTSGRRTFSKWDLEHAVVGSYRSEGDSSTDVPNDRFTFAFTKFTYTYIPQKADGSSGTPVVEFVEFKAPPA